MKLEQLIGELSEVMARLREEGVTDPGSVPVVMPIGVGFVLPDVDPIAVKVDRISTAGRPRQVTRQGRPAVFIVRGKGTP